jgi:hypothetical protein
MGTKVTDPTLLAELNAPTAPVADARGRRVTDPALLAELNREPFNVGQMVRNIPGSALQFAKDVTAPIHSPKQTAKGLWRAGSGAVQLAVPGEQGNEPYARAVGQGLKERYGGTQRLRRTLQADPVGLAADVAGLATGGGSVAARAGLRGTGAALRTVGRNLDPVVAAQRAVGQAIPKSLPRKAMGSALKLRTTLKPKDRAGVVETALQYGITPTARGVERLRGVQVDLGDKIDDLITQAGTSGGSVSVESVLQGLDEVRQRMGGPRVTAAKDVAAINRVERAFRENMNQFGPARLTIEDLQKLKTDAYKQINFDRRQQKARVGTEEAYKSMARDARGEIEKQVPAIAEVNRQYGATERALPEIERAAARVGNRDFMGIGVPIKSTAGAMVGDAIGGPGVGTALGLTAGFFDVPSIKSRMALQAEALRSKRAVGGRTPLRSHTIPRAIVAQTGRLSEDQQE